MARRHSTRGISAARVYIYKQAARIIGVSEATFRKWPKQGLRVITDKRPFLVRGADLIEFLQKRQTASLKPTTKTQCFCMRCKMPREFRERAATYTPQSNLTGRLSGLCAECGCKIGRFCKGADVAELAALLVIVNKANTQAYVDPPPCTETHTSKPPDECDFLQGANPHFFPANQGPKT